MEGNVGYCSHCMRNFKMNVRDFRYEYYKERRQRIAFRNKSTGALLTIFGTIFLIAILYTYYYMAETSGLFQSDELSGDYGFAISFIMLIPCSIILPIFLIITGVLVYNGSFSGTVMFGVICIMFGLSMILAGYLASQSGDEGGWAFNIIFSGCGFAIAGYGMILIKNTIKKPRYI